MRPRPCIPPRSCPPFIAQDSSGKLAFSTPIIEFRLTSADNSCSVQSSVPAGRSGRTRYRISDVESHTLISTSFPISVPNSSAPHAGPSRHVIGKVLTYTRPVAVQELSMDNRSTVYTPQGYVSHLYSPRFSCVLPVDR